jgi:uroporphyrinogen-III decarboxylase
MAPALQEMTHRERYLGNMAFLGADRPLFQQFFGLLPGVAEEWRTQGASEDEIALTAFGFDPGCRGVAVNTRFLGGDPPQLLHEDDEVRIERDAMGRTLKLHKQAASIPLPLDYPVHTRADWERMKPHFEMSRERFRADWAERARQAAGEYPIALGIPGGFSLPRELMGDAAVCLAYYTEPDLMRDMIATFERTALACAEEVCAQVPVDVLMVHEDFAGRSGPLIGPHTFREFIAPYYRRVWEFVRGRGAQVFGLDSDGNLTTIIDALLEAGINEIHPFEVRAGMDIVEVRRRYGRRLAIGGGIDKFALREGRAAIDAELDRRVPAMLELGGWTISADHRILNGTTIENYRHYVQRVWEMIT